MDGSLDVVTTKARYALVTVAIDAVTYVIIDIGLRMFKPCGFARAPGFPKGYILDPIVRKILRGKWGETLLTIAEQISAVSNSVWPASRPSAGYRNNWHWPDEARSITENLCALLNARLHRSGTYRTAVLVARGAGRGIPRITHPSSFVVCRMRN